MPNSNFGNVPRAIVDSSPSVPSRGPTVGVLERAMELLNIISAARRPLGFTELQRISKLPKATLHRMLGTLRAEGLIRVDAVAKHYQLGLRFLELAHQVWGDFDLRVNAQDELLWLRELTGETVQLAVLDGNGIAIVASEAPRTGIRLATVTGQHIPVHSSALGKIIAAYMDEKSQRALLNELTLEAMTPATLTSVSLLQNNLDISHARGYALDLQEHSDGVQGIAVPILNYEGRPIGSLGLSGPAFRLTVEKAHGFAPALIGAARRISHNAGGNHQSIFTSLPTPSDLHSDATCLVDVKALLGEGPIWSLREKVLYWVDILAPAVHRFDPGTGIDTKTVLPSMVSVAIPKVGGGLLLAMPQGLMSYDDETGKLVQFAHPESERHGNRYNDGKCDRRGRLWVATIDMGAVPNRGNLFRVDPDGTTICMDSGFTVANGIGWSPDDRKMYFIDSFRRTVYEYDFDLDLGTIKNRRSLIVLQEGEGVPDGLTVDEEGCLWIAIWDAWKITRYGSDGLLKEELKMPVPRPTSCCFGGEYLDTLFVTSASIRLSEQILQDAPLSGGIFALKPGVRGLSETMFGDNY